MNDRVGIMASTVIAVAIIAIAVIEDDTIVGMLALFLTVSDLVLLYCEREYKVSAKVPLISAVTLVISSLVLMYILNYDSGAAVSKGIYSHIEGLFAWAASYTIGICILMCISYLFGAVYNRVLVGGFSVFSSMAVMTVIWVVVSIISFDKLENSIMFSDELSYLFVNLVASAVTGIIICMKLKNTHYRMERVPKEAPE